MKTPFDKPSGLLERLSYPLARAAYEDGYKLGKMDASANAKSEAWDEAMAEGYACGWLNAYDRDDMFARNPYRSKDSQ